MKTLKYNSNKFCVVRILIVVLAIIIQCVTSCNKTTESEIKELINTVWQLESFEITQGVNVNPSPNQTYILNFFDNSAYIGYSDCNEISGKYESHLNSNLVIKRLRTTYKY
jgi:heat shock protein HslJ